MAKKTNSVANTATATLAYHDRFGSSHLRMHVIDEGRKTDFNVALCVLASHGRQLNRQEMRLLANVILSGGRAIFGAITVFNIDREFGIFVDDGDSIESYYYDSLCYYREDFEEEPEPHKLRLSKEEFAVWKQARKNHSFEWSSKPLTTHLRNLLPQP